MKLFHLTGIPVHASLLAVVEHIYINQNTHRQVAGVFDKQKKGTCIWQNPWLENQLMT